MQPRPMADTSSDPNRRVGRGTGWPSVVVKGADWAKADAPHVDLPVVATAPPMTVAERIIKSRRFT
ncbi:hypothetical protein [Spirosoma harenae]